MAVFMRSQFLTEFFSTFSMLRPLPFTLLSFWLATAGAGIAQENGADEVSGEPSATRIFEQTPHDEIKLKDNTVIKVEPLKLPNRKLPDKPRPSDKLTVQLLDKPDESYEIAWRDIAQVRLFEKMVLEDCAAVSGGRRA